ncbi:MAG TPA: response regulator [Chloroflexota bacterium]|nr:response regulator [Chloroflexota bacterium]
MTQVASPKNPTEIRITIDSVPEPRTRAPEPERKLGTIMVVDDDPRIRQAVQWALEDEGYAVVAAADGRQALDAAATQRPALIVLDNGLPEASGAQVAAQLREIGGESLPILLITADGRAR